MADSDLSAIRVDPTTAEEIQEVKETQGLHNSLQENARSLWFSSIMEEGKEVKNNQPLGPKIPMVPDKLKNDQSNECYNPLVVSIGPYHYKDRSNRLSEVESLKVRMARQFVLSSGKIIELLYSEVKKASSKAREFYNQSSIEGFNDEQFTQMMFLDGCFILQFIRGVTSSNYENLDMSDQQVAHAKRDLLLLENQLPFPVLESLMKLESGNNQHNNHGKELLCHFLFFQILQPKDQPLWARRSLSLWWLLLFAIISPFFFGPLFGILSDAGLLFSLVMFNSLLRSILGKKKKTLRYDWGSDPQPAHLLELLYRIFTNSQKVKRNKFSIISSYFTKCLTKFISPKSKPRVDPGSRGRRYLYYSAKYLKKEGIHFQTNRSHALTDVKFKSSVFHGSLKLPSITIDELTKSLLLNLVAYETSAALKQLWVTSYICFLDSLIDDAEDVKELRSKGILINHLGPDQRVADLFNDMGSFLELDTSAYNDVKREINSECDHSIMKKWVAQWQQTYFSSPWAFIAFGAGAAGLALTATQTYYAMHPPNKKD